MIRKSLLPQVLTLVALALVPAIGQALYFRERISWESSVPASERVTVEKAQAWGAATLWIDARPEDEFAREHLPNALPLNEDHWDAQLPAVLAGWSPEKRVVVYCGEKSCGASRAVAQRLRKEAQLKNVFVLEGGWEALHKSIR
jgi:rhodanese-related sulfurtransferase